MEWGGNEKGEVSLQATQDQGGRDRTTQKEGFQVSKGELAEGNQQGEKEGLRCDIALLIYICVYVYHIK